MTGSCHQLFFFCFHSPNGLILHDCSLKSNMYIELLTETLHFRIEIGFAVITSYDRNDIAAIINDWRKAFFPLTVPVFVYGSHTSFTIKRLVSYINHFRGPNIFFPVQLQSLCLQQGESDVHPPS